MGKRTIRIPRSKIASEVENLTGKTVQVVMVDGRTHAGQVVKVDGTQVVVADLNAAWTSRSRHKQTLQVPDIHYIVFDTISAW